MILSSNYNIIRHEDARHNQETDSSNTTTICFLVVTRKYWYQNLASMNIFGHIIYGVLMSGTRWIHCK